MDTADEIEIGYTSVTSHSNYFRNLLKSSLKKRVGNSPQVELSCNVELADSSSI